MPRTTTLDTIAADPHAKWFVLIEVADIPTTLYLTTFDDQPTDFASYRAWLINTMIAVGPELDWRGGLAADEPFSVLVAQEFSSVTGTATSNTFERLFPLFAHENYSGSFRESVILNGGAGKVTVKLGSYNSVPAGVSATIYTGQTRNISIEDYSGLRLEFGSSLRANLDRTFLARLGREPAGQENYDTTLGRPIVSQSEGLPVPIVYGIVPYCEGLYVHEESTRDDTARSGLIICFSDIRFETNRAGSRGTLDAPYLSVYDQQTDEMYDVMAVDLEAGTSGDPQYEITATNLTCPELNLVLSGIGSGTATKSGFFVRFTDEDDTPAGEDAPRLAGGGKLLVRRGAATEKVDQAVTQKTLVRTGFTFVSSGGAALWTSEENGSDGDDTTFATTTLVTGAGGQSNGSRRYYSWTIPQMGMKGQMYRLFLRPKYTHTGTAGTQNTRAWYSDGTSIQTSYDYVAGATTNQTASSFNSWTGADSKYRFGWAPTVTPAELNRGGLTQIRLGINATSGMTQTMNVYGADYEIWWDVDWSEFRNKVYSYCEGVEDNSHQYTSGANATLRNPAEIFEHFVEEVCGLTSSGASAAATAMDADGLLADLQITDGEMTRGEFLDSFALQFMSWIVPDDDGALKLIYRPSLLEPVNLASPITKADILKGTFKTYFTDADELYAGVIVNYAWNAPRQRYEGQWVIAPTASQLETNVTSPTDYQGLADMVDVDRERILEIDAWMIRDADTAELLCKWLMQQHCRRRQIVEFETTLEHFDVLPGDVICINDPRIRVFASGDDALGSTTALQNTSTSDWPATNTMRAAHRGDMAIIESGTYAGQYIVNPATDSIVGVLYSSSALPVSATSVGPWRIVPTFDVLAAQVVFDQQKGPRMKIKAIEHPIIRAGATDI